MIYSKRHLPDTEQWSQSSCSNVQRPEAARPGCPGLAGLRTHRVCKTNTARNIDGICVGFGVENSTFGDEPFQVSGKISAVVCFRVKNAPLPVSLYHQDTLMNSYSRLAVTFRWTFQV